jgi:hypothetical protein
MAECACTNAKENAMKTTNATHANRRLKPGTRVVSQVDGEPGRVVRVCTYRRNGIDAWSYLVDTADGREIWETGELFVPAPEQA